MLALGRSTPVSGHRRSLTGGYTMSVLPPKSTGMSGLCQKRTLGFRRGCKDIVGCHRTANGPQLNVAKAAGARIAKEILNEALPLLALKHSPRSFGACGFFGAINKRALS
jgi:hypothetical protein